MSKQTSSIIKEITGREIFDSRGLPTVEVDVLLASGAYGRMMVPAGASTGKFEACELRDNDKRFRGKGVTKAVGNVNGTLKKLLVGKNAEAQEFIDELLIEEDGTLNKSRLGANAIVGVSLAVARAAAANAGKPFYQFIADKYLQKNISDLCIPVPMVNIISGGLHAGRNIDVQDFLLMPAGARSYTDALEIISNVYWATQDCLHKKGYNAYLLADEGGFGPSLSSNKEALDILMEVFAQCGYEPHRDVALALDIASSTFYDADRNSYHLQSEKKWLDRDKMVDMLESWTKDYPVVSIEDGLAQEDWEGWQLLTKKLGSTIQLVGDDLFVTNSERVNRGALMGAGNAVLIKMNQVGTLTETVKAVNAARQAGFEIVISARSGETEDDTLADLAVGLNANQIKIGSFAGSSRLAKYNQLARINTQLNGRYAGGKFSFGNKYSSNISNDQKAAE